MTRKKGSVIDFENDRRLKANGGGRSGQGQVKNASLDQRFAKNREGPSGGGRVKNQGDGRLMKNRVRNNFIKYFALSDCPNLAQVTSGTGHILVEIVVGALSRNY